MSFDLFSGGGATILRRQLFTTVGTENWNRPAKMLGDTVWITAIGGGGKADVGVGGRGGQFIQRLPVTIDSAVASVPVTVGEVTVGAYGTGGPSSFGVYVTVLGPGGSAATRNVGSPGNDQTFSGDGPPGPFGSGKQGFLYSGGGGLILDNTGKVYGAGRNGSASGSAPGTGGADGAVLVEWLEAI